jgi:transposase
MSRAKTEQWDEVARLVDDGMTLREASRRLGVSYARASERCRDRGVCAQLPRDKTRRAEIVDAIKRRWTDDEVAEEFGVTINTARRWRAQVERTSTALHQVDRAKIRRLAAEGLSYRKIAKEMRCSPSTAWRALRDSPKVERVRPPKAELVDAIERWGIVDTAEEYGVEPDQIEKWQRAYELVDAGRGIKPGQKTPRKPVDRDRIEVLYLTGHSARAVSRQTGCSINTVRKVLRERGVEMRGRRSYDYERLAAMYERLGSSQAVADAVGCNRQTVIDAARACGVSINAPGRPVEP